MKKNQEESKAPKRSSYMHFESQTPLHNQTNVNSSSHDLSRNTETREFIDELGIPYLKVNHFTEIIAWNQSFVELTDMRSAYLHDSTIEELSTHDELLSFAYQLILKVLSNNEAVDADFEEGELYVRVKVLQPCEKGEMYLIFEDRSLQKQFENLLTFHHQMEAVSHIAAGVAHELRNPLSVIKGFMQLAKLTGDHDKYYDTVLSELNRMNGIIEDFLSVSRKKIGRKKQSPFLIMSSLIEIIKSECLLHDVELTLELTPTKSLVCVNESMVKQVVLNLLRNSIEAYGSSNTSRLFKVQTFAEEDFYRIVVSDNGKGMPQSVLEQLGKPFFTTKETGTGIGIPLCKKIIEDHGGSFHISSEFNVGTAVTLTLPTVMIE
ncbi:two-component system sensor histidine kinase NtrB [Bacillus sp. FJAT-45037]|uniref:two-component system sensor histidine kinase NtrB n=1 Tax=Bacillus sp. FJAT-45037 TaxID=2011007 RepID=UPI000C2342B1|nr:ATP-binding protein [Bacillus sp. FJAT-45037]